MVGVEGPWVSGELTENRDHFGSRAMDIVVVGCPGGSRPDVVLPNRPRYNGSLKQRQVPFGVGGPFGTVDIAVDARYNRRHHLGARSITAET